MDVSVTAKEIPVEQNIFTEMWNTYKMFFKADGSDEYWDEFIFQINQITQKYHSSKLAVLLGVAILEDREYFLKEKEKQSKN